MREYFERIRAVIFCGEEVYIDPDVEKVLNIWLYDG
jgi:hypothetical protein